MSVVKIINTDLNVGNKNILKNINFSISEGEMVFLIGKTVKPQPSVWQGPVNSPGRLRRRSVVSDPDGLCGRQPGIQNR